MVKVGLVKQLKKSRGFGMCGFYGATAGWVLKQCKTKKIQFSCNTLCIGTRDVLRKVVVESESGDVPYFFFYAPSGIAVSDVYRLSKASLDAMGFNFRMYNDFNLKFKYSDVVITPFSLRGNYVMDSSVREILISFRA